MPAVRGRGRRFITATRSPHGYATIGAPGGVGAADALVVGERTSLHEEGSTGVIEDAATHAIVDKVEEAGAAAAVTAVPRDGLVAAERAVLDGEASPTTWSL